VPTLIFLDAEGKMVVEPQGPMTKAQIEAVFKKMGVE